MSDDHGADASPAHAIDTHDHDTLLAAIRSELAALLHIADPARIPLQASFDSLGLDSLTTLEFCGRLGKRLGRSITAEMVAEHASPGALVTHLLARGDGRSADDGGAGRRPGHTLQESLANLQALLQSSHPTFQAAKAPAWCATDKANFVREVLRMVNEQRRNPYGKVLRTGSATRGTVGDAYNDESQDAIIWTTNLYLGLNRDADVIAQARDALERYGTGMGTSAAASGMTEQHLAFEREFAELVGKPAACVFPPGYTANVGAVAGLLGKHDVVVIDQLCHASIVDGARLCGATIRSFRHNDDADLDAVLASECSPYRTALVVLEGVYSMGEGAAPVAEVVRTAKRHGALVLVDEAHSFGFYGPRGAGICAAQGVTDQVDFIMTTLSKALGSLGGVVAASEAHVDLLKSSARAYIFQASISPADTAAALTALRRIRSDDSLRERLWDTTRYMRQRFVDAGYDLGTGDGPIVTPHFGDKDKLYALVQALYRRGIQTSAVTYPIVEVGRGRLRLICSAAHTREDVDRTLDALIEAEREVDARRADRGRARSGRAARHRADHAHAAAGRAGAAAGMGRGFRRVPARDTRPRNERRTRSGDHGSRAGLRHTGRPDPARRCGHRTRRRHRRPRHLPSAAHRRHRTRRTAGLRRAGPPACRGHRPLRTPRPGRAVRVVDRSAGGAARALGRVLALVYPFAGRATRMPASSVIRGACCIHLPGRAA